MAQTTDPVSAVNATIQLSTDNVTWTTDISGSTNSIEPGEQTRQSGFVMTHTGDTSLIAGGKREPLELNVNIVYTEQSTEAFEVVRGFFEATGGTNIYMRYSPKGGSATNSRFTSALGVITKLAYPPANAEDAKPKLVSFSLLTPSLTKTVI